jgi:hypothetical protein
MANDLERFARAWKLANDGDGGGGGGAAGGGGGGKGGDGKGQGPRRQQLLGGPTGNEPLCFELEDMKRNGAPHPYCSRAAKDYCRWGHFDGHGVRMTNEEAGKHCPPQELNRGAGKGGGGQGRGGGGAAPRGGTITDAPDVDEVAAMQASVDEVVDLKKRLSEGRIDPLRLSGNGGVNLDLIGSPAEGYALLLRSGTGKLLWKVGCLSKLGATSVQEMLTYVHSEALDKFGNPLGEFGVVKLVKKFIEMMEAAEIKPVVWKTEFRAPQAALPAATSPGAMSGLQTDALSKMLEKQTELIEKLTQKALPQSPGQLSPPRKRKPRLPRSPDMGGTGTGPVVGRNSAGCGGRWWRWPPWKSFRSDPDEIGWPCGGGGWRLCGRVGDEVCSGVRGPPGVPFAAGEAVGGLGRG